MGRRCNTRGVKRGIAQGNGIAALRPVSDILDRLPAAGFEVEAVGLAPRGTLTVHDVLRQAQWSLVDAGRRGIFTPWVARKPQI